MKSLSDPEMPDCRELSLILDSKTVTLSDGSTRPLTSASSLVECAAMYRILRREKPDLVVEIGMAYGVSALTILSALRDNQNGRLISIDPYNKWESARLSALAAVERAGLAGFHEHRHGASELELPRLVAGGVRCDFVYVDGHHGFDHAFVDMFFSDELLRTGGILAFDDSQWRSVHRVMTYLRRHRSYEEMDIGIPRSYSSSTPFGGLIKRLQGRFGSSRYFRKTDDWKAPYDFYRAF